MRPNVICWVEVKCDMKRISVAMNSRAKLATKTMDEFLIEFCPVPGAMSTMTCDLYTSSVHSNLPELLNIWEVRIKRSKINLRTVKHLFRYFYMLDTLT